MKIILYGDLRDRYGETHILNADSVADAIEGLTRQLPDFPVGLMVDVIGFDTEDKLRGKTDAEDIHVVPAMCGGGGKFTGIIIGAVLVVVGVITANPYLIIQGGTMILMGVVGLFMKAPSVDKTQDPPASKYLGVNKNTSAIGTRLTLAWGRIDLGGHWLSLNSDADKMVTGTWTENPT